MRRGTLRAYGRWCFVNAGNKSIGVPGVAIVFGNGVPVVLLNLKMDHKSGGKSGEN
jgi:hypothetical protein